MLTYSHLLQALERSLPGYGDEVPQTQSLSAKSHTWSTLVEAFGPQGLWNSTLHLKAPGDMAHWWARRDWIRSCLSYLRLGGKRASQSSLLFQYFEVCNLRLLWSNQVVYQGGLRTAPRKGSSNWGSWSQGKRKLISFVGKQESARARARDDELSPAATVLGCIW